LNRSSENLITLKGVVPSRLASVRRSVGHP
jgi:hypothetical protein